MSAILLRPQCVSTQRPGQTHKTFGCIYHHLIFIILHYHISYCHIIYHEWSIHHIMLSSYLTIIFPRGNCKSKDQTLGHALRTRPFITSFSERPLIHNADLTYNKFPYEDTDGYMECMVKELMWGKLYAWICISTYNTHNVYNISWYLILTST